MGSVLVILAVFSRARDGKKQIWGIWFAFWNIGLCGWIDVKRLQTL
jgi:hypothetical protein